VTGVTSSVVNFAIVDLRDYYAYGWLLVVLAAHVVFQIRAKCGTVLTDYVLAHDSRATGVTRASIDLLMGYRLRRLRTRTLCLSK
jgi:hypothetical protein